MVPMSALRWLQPNRSFRTSSATAQTHRNQRIMWICSPWL